MEKTKKIRITQRRSAIGVQKKQKDTLRALGLKKINGAVVQPYSPSIQGMVKRVAHLVDYELLDEPVNKANS